MREKVKIGVFAVSIFYSVMIFILALTSYATSVSEIELHDSEENIIKLDQYEKELYSLPQNSCTTAIYDVIRYYKETSYNGYVDIKDFYNNYNDNFPQGFYSECNISDSEADYYRYKWWIEVWLYNEMFDKFNAQFQIGFSSGMWLDYFASFEYPTIKTSELEMISNLIESAKEGVLTNE